MLALQGESGTGKELPEMSSKKIFAGWDCLACARWLVIAELVSLFISTSLTSVIEILLFASIAWCLFRRGEDGKGVLRQPATIMTIIFVGVLCLGFLYGETPLLEKIRALFGWRKLLLVPIVLFLFGAPVWKQRLAWALLGIATIGVLLSYLGLLGLYGRGGTPFLVVHNNHAMQGMFFAVATFVAVIMFFRGEFPRLKLLCRGLLSVAIFLGMNVIFVTPGRSGYLVLFVLTCVTSFVLFQGRLRILKTVVVVISLLALLFVSPIATQRMEMAFNDIQSYEHSENESSLGLRMVMWTNTFHMIKDRPFLGYGLGGMKDAYRKQVAGVGGWKGWVVDDPHNQYLKIMVEHGVLGLLAFLCFVGAFFFQRVSQPYRVLGLGVLLAWCATSFFSGHFSTSEEGRFLMLWVSAQLAVSNIGEQG